MCGPYDTKNGTNVTVPLAHMPRHYVITKDFLSLLINILATALGIESTTNLLTAKVSRLLQSWEVNMKEFIKWCNQKMWVILGHLSITTVHVILYETFFV